ncbi:MAG: CoA transferase [Archaeoglobi archaeon]|nr:CoA transferase [Archaeoglobi archaeon]
MRKSALDGVRVLDITRIIYGPWAATLLAQLGAEVIHVELPGSGDTLVRLVSPGGVFPRNISPGMMCCNANKYYVAIDLRKEEGRELIRELAAKSDVLMENFKPGTFDRWGIGYRQLSRINPQLIYVSMQGFGNWGELWERPSYDAYAQGITGLAEITGFEEAMPVKSQAWIGDFLSGTVAAFTTLVALFWRNRSGRGQFIDMSQAEVLLRVMDWTWLYIALTNRNRKRYGNRDPAVVPSCIVRCEDGFAAIAAFSENEYRGLCEAMGREDLLEFLDYESRIRNAERIYDAIESWASGKKVEEVVEAGFENGFAAAEVMSSAKLHSNEHFNERRAVWKYFDPIYEDLCYPFALHLSKTPGSIRWSMRPVGFDNEHVFRRVLGMSEDELEELYRKGVIGKWDASIPTTAPPEGKEGKTIY